MSSSEAEDQQVENIKACVIGVINAALSAHEFEDDKRLEQYRHDFLLLIEDLTIQDICMGMSLMGDVAASLVTVLAKSYDIDPKVAMLQLANEIKSTQARGGE